MTVAQPAPTQPVAVPTTPRSIILVMKSNEVYEIAKYQINGTQLEFDDLSGKRGSVTVKDVDWRKTTQLISAVRSVDLPAMVRQIN